jgi:predicted nucleotidyltransferase
MNDSKWKKLAEDNTILRCVVGSTAYGLNLTESGDRDEVGVCLEPLEALLGFHEFEQFEFRTATERTGIKDAKSEAGDLDLKIYSLKKFLRLALQGNPSVIELFFTKSYVKVDALGHQLQELYPQVVSRQCGKRFLGYMEAQRQRLLGEVGQKKVNRPELEEKHGYDTKYAMHILRLGMQGVELLETGKISLPFEGEKRDYLLGVRKGLVPINDVLGRAGDLERRLKDLLDDSPLSEHPNEALVEDWMITRYWNWWKALRFQSDHNLLSEFKVQ